MALAPLNPNQPIKPTNRTSLLRIYQAMILSRINYGCAVYGSACNSVLRKLDPVHHSALRICSGAFRTSPIESLYAECHQMSLSLRRQKLSLKYYFKLKSISNHPLRGQHMSNFFGRFYDARPSRIRPFHSRIKRLLYDMQLGDFQVQTAGVFHYPPWSVHSVKLIGLFDEFRKNDTSSLILLQIFFSHRFEYVDYTAVYTDGSRAPGRVGFGVVIDDATYSHGLSEVFSVYSAEAMAILYALQRISRSDN
ncbi:hypothetical protein AVEN_11232-1 [Araneus ventricosus]|uniref:RNase H type-1 domain-containing protein n=1 Tax=Araneus ventricosus TaxID=182803 RepID=A0A4Y2RM38_ARAVE|nr:hypothetical protein AVEN_11232-1 [Araneus ventricosus]